MYFLRLPKLFDNRILSIKTCDVHLNSVRVQQITNRTMNFLILCFLAFTQTFAMPDRQRDVVETSWYSSQSATYGLPHDEYGVPPPPEVPALEYGVLPAVPQVISETTEQ
jgi:hypothetical protein